jgi:hypothetical protein
MHHLENSSNMDPAVFNLIYTLTFYKIIIIITVAIVIIFLFILVKVKKITTISTFC